MGGLAPPNIIARRATRRCSGSGSNRSIFIISTRTIESVPLADSLGAFDKLAEGGQDPHDRPVAIHRAAARRGDRRSRPPRHAQARALADQVQSRRARQVRRRAARPAQAARPWRLPVLRLANGFLTGKYRSKDDLGKSTRGQRVATYLEGRGMRVLGAFDEIASETGAALATISIAWIMAQPTIVAPIASATSVGPA